MEWFRCGNMERNARCVRAIFVQVTFTGDDNVRHTHTMYPGDTTGKPLFLDDIFYRNYETCKFNLIDCGWEE